jgi:hypothetical protein
VVVRFNRATTAGKERCIGSRTDIVVANEGNNLNKAPSPENTVQPKCVVTFIKTPSLRGGDLPWQEPFFAWVASTPLFLTCGPEILCCDVPKRRRGFSMGTYALAALPHFLAIEKLFVTGFTMFGAVEGGAHHYCKTSNATSVTWHDAELERQVFAHLLASAPCELKVTEEVARLMHSEGYNPEQQSLTRVDFGLKRKAPVQGLPWYLLGRVAKGMLKTGYGLRRLAEQRRMQLS